MISSSYLPAHKLSSIEKEGKSACNVVHTSLRCQVHGAKSTCLQGLSEAAGSDVRISFTPHLMPMSRGMQSTVYVKLSQGTSVDDLRSHLQVSGKCDKAIHVN